MIPKVSVENIQFSKIVCVTNQFVGITHRPNPFGIYAHLRRFRNPETVAKFMIYLFQEHGINCCLSSPRDKIYEAIKITEKEIGEKFHWICSPSMRRTAKDLPRDVFKQVDWCMERHVSICLMQRGYVDHAINKDEKVIGGYQPEYPPYPEISAYIRDKGMVPGLTSHFHETLIAAEENDYDAPVIVIPFNKIGFINTTSIDELKELIQKTKRQIIAIKPMAAGRIPPKEGLKFTLNNIKDNDLMAIGFGKFEYCVEDGKILEEYFNKQS